MKHVPLIDEVHADLKLVTKYQKSLAPHKTITMQGVAASLIVREAKRIRKIKGDVK